MAQAYTPTGFEGSLVANTPRAANTVLVGGTVVWRFTSAPPDADPVAIGIYDWVEYLGGATPPDDEAVPSLAQRYSVGLTPPADPQGIPVAAENASAPAASAW